LRSLVVPRHQVRADYFPAIAGAGFVAHRSNERNSLNGPSATGKEPLIRRGLRLMDSYVSITGPNSVEWGATRPRSGLVDIRESRFLRPYQHHLSSLDPLRIHRIIASMES